MLIRPHRVAQMDEVELLRIQNYYFYRRGAETQRKENIT